MRCDQKNELLRVLEKYRLNGFGAGIKRMRNDSNIFRQRGNLPMVLEFEEVYKNASVSMNNTLVYTYPNGNRSSTRPLLLTMASKNTYEK
jgi:hypothetical protein